MRSFTVLSKQFIFMSDAGLPTLVLVCGPCRSGTTAFSHNFNIIGIESHMQPLKSIRRLQAGLGDDVPIPDPILFRDSGHILIKETLGANVPAELFDPVGILLEAGYPADKIVVVGMVREPESTYDSWQRLWNGSVNVEIFQGAYEQMQRIWDRCKAGGIRYLPYASEAIRVNDPVAVLQGVMRFLGLSFQAEAMCDWDGRPLFADDKKLWPNMHFYDTPPPRFIAGVREWGGFRYRHTTREGHEVPGVTRAIYERHRQGCEEALDLRI